MEELKTVLVVDDDPGIVDLVRMALEDEGYAVATSVSGHTMGVARDLRPAVILLDIAMPDMDGVEVSKRLRRDPYTADIPIIVMSAQDRLQAAAALMPVDDRLPKPFELDHLYEKVAYWAAAS